METIFCIYIYDQYALLNNVTIITFDALWSVDHIVHLTRPPQGNPLHYHSRTFIINLIIVPIERSINHEQLSHARIICFFSHSWCGCIGPVLSPQFNWKLKRNWIENKFTKPNIEVWSNMILLTYMTKCKIAFCCWQCRVLLGTEASLQLNTWVSQVWRKISTPFHILIQHSHILQININILPKYPMYYAMSALSSISTLVSDRELAVLFRFFNLFATGF